MVEGKFGGGTACSGRRQELEDRRPFEDTQGGGPADAAKNVRRENPGLPDRPATGDGLRQLTPVLVSHTIPPTGAKPCVVARSNGFPAESIGFLGRTGRAEVRSTAD